PIPRMRRVAAPSSPGVLLSFRPTMWLLEAAIVHVPFAFHLGPLTVTGFGLGVLAGFWIGQLVGQRELARRGFDPDPVSDVVMAAVLGFIVGAKLYYAALVGDWSALLSRAGFVFWGGLAGGVAAGWIVIRRKGIPFWRIADVAGPGIAAGYAVGRTGCWAVGDDYGKPWPGGWLAVEFPQGAPPSTAGVMAREFGIAMPPGAGPDTVLAVHPTQLYEVAMGLIMFAILWRLRDHRHAEGWLFGLYCVLAGIERFIVEIFRAKDDRFFGPLTTAQLVAVAVSLVGVALVVRFRTPGGSWNRRVNAP
ncbi:MAG TPA: prolipoprotein diacylglyceryl transferase, partial [Gemmatimonadaceae bacterium]|nr:prolipoprotein diacylglyceryl transferase [Gemmatimonadaceae bacterium]